MSAVRLSLFAGVATTLTCLSACSYMYNVTFDVTLDPGVASRTGVVILAASSDQVVVPHTTGATRHTGVVGVCCAPDPRVEIRAFFDENGNQKHDPGEIIASYPANPVTLKGDLQVSLRLVAPASP